MMGSLVSYWPTDFRPSGALNASRLATYVKCAQCASDFPVDPRAQAVTVEPLTGFSYQCLPGGGGVRHHLVRLDALPPVDKDVWGVTCGKCGATVGVRREGGPATTDEQLSFAARFGCPDHDVAALGAAGEHI